MDTDDEDKYEDRCSICFEEFQFPKILVCKHTFCLPCLEDYHGRLKTPYKAESIRCPICQTLCVLPEGGLCDLSTNFFVSVHKAESDDNIDADTSELEKIDVHDNDEDDINDETNSDSEKSDDDTNLVVNSNFSFPLTPHTKFCAELDWQLSLFDSERENNMITSLFPTQENQCYVILNSSSTCLKLNKEGTITEENDCSLEQNIHHVVERTDGSTLFVFPTGIVSMIHGVLDIFVLDAGVYFNDIDIFPDMKVVAVGYLEDDENKGFAVIFSKTGKREKLLNKQGDVFNPLRVAVNPVNEFICVSDIGNRCIDIFLQDGIHINTFKGDLASPLLLRFLPDHSHSIFPLGICCDGDGNIMFIDRETKCVFVLNSQGDFVGVILSSRPGGFGEPNMLACCKDGGIILGDMLDGSITKYVIKRYMNSF